MILKELSEMIKDLTLAQTPAGKILLFFDGFGTILSLGFYGFEIGDMINQVLPPIILMLTVVSLITSIIYKAAYEIRQYRKRKAEKQIDQ